MDCSTNQPESRDNLWKAASIALWKANVFTRLIPQCLYSTFSPHLTSSVRHSGKILDARSTFTISGSSISWFPPTGHASALLEQLPTPPNRHQEQRISPGSSERSRSSTQRGLV